jgi:branched-subunit amino acid aminotransferase/4-amino-4-deoxychorismate lyase
MTPMPTTPKMKNRVMLNGRVLASSRARISPLGEGFMYGRGLFETIRVLGGRPVFLREHLARLRRGAGALHLPPRGSDRSLAARCSALIAATGLGDGVLKIVLFQDERETGELILARPAGYGPSTYARGFRLTAVPDARAPGSVSGFKTLNYLGNSVARRKALAGGFDEALFVDGAGRVLEGSGTNVFAVEGAQLLTPPLRAGILPGIARMQVLRLRAGRESRLTLKRLLGASEVFVTNAIVGIMPVSQIGRHRFDLDRNPVTRALQRAYRAAQSRSASQRRTRPATKSIAAG